MRSKLSKLGTFPLLKTQEDFALWLRFLRKGVKFNGINSSLVYWRDTPGSLSKNVIQKLKIPLRFIISLKIKTF